MAIASRTKRAGTVGRERNILKWISVIKLNVVWLRKFLWQAVWTLTEDYTICKLTKWRFRYMCHHVAVLSWLTWNKEHGPRSKGAVEPLKSREVGKGEDSCDDASEAWHGGEDHESPSGIPVSWGGAKQGREHTVKICAGRSTTNSIITTVLHTMSSS